MVYLTGEYDATLDEKNRISLPANFRRDLDVSYMHITEGNEKCLRLYTPLEWEKVVNEIMDNTNPYNKTGRDLRRRIIGPAHKVEIDKVGRIPVPSSLREYSGILKECMVVGQIEYIEIWSKDNYTAFKQADDEDFEIASEELGNILKNRGKNA